MVNEKTNTGLKEGRLQRKMSPSGIYVATFREIILRHGLTMAIISLLCLFVTGAIDIVILGFSSLIAGTFFYLVAMFVILVFFIAFLVFRGQKIGPTQYAWLGYLLIISFLEELSFRLILPTLLLGTVGMIPAVLLSNLVFASFHFFTLRWKFFNCLGAFLGGIGLSRLLVNTEDIALVILVHWFFTFLNTPTAPKDAL